MSVFPSAVQSRRLAMDDQDKVFSQYPRAEVREEPLIFEHGEPRPIEVAHWAIFADPNFDAEELGRGKTEAKAWADAARKLKCTPIKAV
jgi:hypothetical protein